MLFRLEGGEGCGFVDSAQAGEKTVKQEKESPNPFPPFTPPSHPSLILRGSWSVLGRPFELG